MLQDRVREFERSVIALPLDLSPRATPCATADSPYQDPITSELWREYVAAHYSPLRSATTPCSRELADISAQSQRYKDLRDVIKLRMTELSSNFQWVHNANC